MPIINVDNCGDSDPKYLFQDVLSEKTETVRQLTRMWDKADYLF